MMKKSVLILILSLIAAVMLPVGSAVQAQDGVITLTGAINDGSGCRLYDGWWPYDVQSFTATVSGPHTFTYVSHTWGG